MSRVTVGPSVGAVATVTNSKTDIMCLEKTIGLLTRAIHKDYNSSSIYVIVIDYREELHQLVVSYSFTEHLLNA